MPLHTRPPPEPLATPGAGEGGGHTSMDPPCVLLQALVVAESLCAQLALPEFRTSMNHLPVPLEGGEGFACE